jgi:hypothetical protein
MTGFELDADNLTDSEVSNIVERLMATQAYERHALMFPELPTPAVLHMACLELREADWKAFILKLFGILAIVGLGFGYFLYTSSRNTAAYAVKDCIEATGPASTRNGQSLIVDTATLDSCAHKVANGTF